MCRFNLESGIVPEENEKLYKISRAFEITELKLLSNKWVLGTEFLIDVDIGHVWSRNRVRCG